MLNDPWSTSLNRSGSGSSFFEYWTSACIFSSRPIERNSLNTRSMDGGMPELGGALSISRNLIMFRETDHQLNGEVYADEESDRHMGRRTQKRKGELQGRKWRDQRSVQLQLTVRERSRIEPRRVARRGRSRLFQHGPQQRSGEERHACHEDRDDRGVHDSGCPRRLWHHHDEAKCPSDGAQNRQGEVRPDRAGNQRRVPGLESIEGQRRSPARGEIALNGGSGKREVGSEERVGDGDVPTQRN